MRGPVRDRLSQLLRYVVALVALLWVLSRGEWQESVETLTNVSGLVLVVLIGLTVVGLLFRFLMWYAFINFETPIQFRTAAEIDLVVNFLNQLLPSRLSGRAAAPLVLSQRTNIDIGTGTGLTGANTALYAIVYGLVSAVGVALSVGRLSIGVLGVLLLSTSLYLLAGLVLLITGLNATVISMLTNRLLPFVRRVPGMERVTESVSERVPQFTEQSTMVFRRTIYTPSIVGPYLIGWLASAALFPALRVAILFETFGVSFTPLVTLPLVLVAAYSITLLPLTPGGIGVTEATAAAVFVSLGVPYEVSAATVLVDRVLGVYIPALLGWYPMVRENPLTLETG